MGELVRVSIAIEKDLLERFDAVIEASGAGNRSEALRDLVRERLLEHEATKGAGEAVGTVTLLYDHRRRRLADDLVEAGHEHHHEVLASMHVHLDHDHCLEVVALKGRRSLLRRVADAMIAMKGVLHGKLVLSGVDAPAPPAPSSGGKARPHRHGHKRGHGHSHTAVLLFALLGAWGLAATPARAHSPQEEQQEQRPGERQGEAARGAQPSESDPTPAAPRPPSPKALPEATREQVESDEEDDDDALDDDAGGVDPPEPSELDAVVVEGRAEKLVGVARSGSEGAVGAAQLEDRPILRNAELLEVIPGFIATQHSGTGKANQYFLRGFNLDHGSDFSLRVDGVPVNLPTHAHGQGYLDVNFLIPELVREVRYEKGPYDAAVGDFSSAGSARMTTFDRLDRGFAQLAAGSHGFGRALLANSTALAGGDLLYAGEFQYYDGPWERDEALVKGNSLMKWTRGDHDGGTQVFAGLYRADWNATDQVPLRAVRDGSLSRRGTVDPTSGGDTTRATLSASAWKAGERSHTRGQLYGVYYALDLFSNFTYYLDDPVSGDQIHQHDRRGVFGGDLTHDWYGDVAGFLHESRVGATVRHDWIPSVALRRSSARELLYTVRDDDVNETAMALWGDTSVSLLDKLRLIAGLRVDTYRFGVDSDLAANSGTKWDAIASPKLGLVVGPWKETEGYVNFGTGFHSNDARGTVIRVDPVTGGPADQVDPLVRSTGAEAGVRTEAVDGLFSTLALWMLDLDSELVFVGDAGNTEAGPPSRRFGVEWANYWQPLDGTAIDFDLSWTHARLRETPDAADAIPGSIPLVIAAGAKQDLPFDLYAELRLRYLGSYPMSEDDNQDSGSTTLVNLRTGWDPDDGDWAVHVDFLNLFDSKDRDIAYYYESRLQGEASGVEDVHFHPVEPFSVRVAVERKF